LHLDAWACLEIVEPIVELIVSLSLRVLPIKLPSLWVCFNVMANSIQGIFLAYNMFVVVPPP
jgi:hypothetical protein